MSYRTFRGAEWCARFPLHAAADAADLAEIQRLADEGTALNLQDAFGWTALHYAYQPGGGFGLTDDIEATTILLLSLGADANVGSVAEKTVLDDAYEGVTAALELASFKRYAKLVRKHATTAVGEGTAEK